MGSLSSSSKWDYTTSKNILKWCAPLRFVFTRCSGMGILSPPIPGGVNSWCMHSTTLDTTTSTHYLIDYNKGLASGIQISSRLYFDFTTCSKLPLGITVGSRWNVVLKLKSFAFVLNWELNTSCTESPFVTVEALIAKHTTKRPGMFHVIKYDLSTQKQNLYQSQDNNVLLNIVIYIIILE